MKNCMIKCEFLNLPMQMLKMVHKNTNTSPESITHYLDVS